MVHWLGEGTNVMLCLARQSPPEPTEKLNGTSPSGVYISYDNGNKFEDKTALFKVNNSTGAEVNSTLDEFTTNPIYNTVRLKK